MVIATVVFCALLALAAVLWVFLYNRVVKKDIVCQSSWEHAKVEIEEEAAIAREVQGVLKTKGEAPDELSELTAAIDALDGAPDAPHTLAASDILSQVLTSTLSSLSHTMGLDELVNKGTAAFERSSKAKEFYRKSVSDFNRVVEEFPTRLIAEARFRKRNLAVAQA